MSHKARYEKSVKLGDVVSYNRHLCLVASVQYDLFGYNYLGIYCPRDKSYKIVSVREVQSTDYYFISEKLSDKFDFADCLFIRPCSSRYFYTSGLRHFDGWRDEVFDVCKVDPSRRMVYLVPCARYKIGTWVTYSEFLHCFKLVKE